MGEVNMNLESALAGQATNANEVDNEWDSLDTDTDYDTNEVENAPEDVMDVENDVEQGEEEGEAEEPKTEVKNEEGSEEEEETEKEETEDEEDSEEKEEVEGNKVPPKEENEGEKLHKVVIDGKEEEVSLQELKNSYSGEKAVAKKFTELDRERKAYQAEVKQINSYINDFAGKMRNGDVVGAFEFFGQFANIPPYMIKEQLVAALKPEIERRATMSVDELQNEYLTSQNAHLTQQNESAAKRRQEEVNQQELLRSINSIREAHNIDDNEWYSAIDQAEATLQENQVLTPELVKETVIVNRADSTAVRLLSEVDSKLAETEWRSNLKDVILDNPDFTEEDLKGIIQHALEKSGYVNNEQKLKQKLAKTKKKATSKKVKKQPEVTSYDTDLEEFFG